MKWQIGIFVGMEEKISTTWQMVNLEKKQKKSKSNLSKLSTITSMLQIAMYLL